MADSVYNVVELVGTSTESWELAARAAVEQAAKSLRDLRIAEVVQQDVVIEKWQGGGLSHQAETILQIRSLIGDSLPISQRVQPEAMTGDQPFRKLRREKGLR
jgi:flavin-binding protein dodecin